MRVMVIVKASKESESGAMPGSEDVRRDGQVQRGAGEGRHHGRRATGCAPAQIGKRVHFSGTKRTVTDGPFAETKELIAGYWVWNVKSMDEAVEWVKRCPNPHPDDSDIEIRPFFEMEDFGPAFTPEERAREERLRKQLRVERRYCVSRPARGPLLSRTGA